MSVPLFIESISKEGKDLLSFQELKEMIAVRELVSLTKEKEVSYHGRNTVSLWFIENDFDGMEFKDNIDLRFCTKGEKCYLGMNRKFVFYLYSDENQIVCSHTPPIFLLLKVKDNRFIRWFFPVIENNLLYGQIFCCPSAIS